MTLFFDIQNYTDRETGTADLEITELATQVNVSSQLLQNGTLAGYAATDLEQLRAFGAPLPTTSDDILVAGFWTVIGFSAILMNLLIIAGVAHNRRMRQATSYWFIISLAACDISMLLVYFILLIPATTLHDDYVTLESTFNSVSVFVYDAFWYTGVLHLVLMSLNRYVNICQSMSYANAFSPTATIAYISLSYLVGTMVAAPGLFSCCRLVYNHHFYAAVYVPDTTLYSYADIIVNGVSVLVLIYCYLRIVIKVRQSRIAISYYGLNSKRKKSRLLSLTSRKSSSTSKTNNVSQSVASGSTNTGDLLTAATGNIRQSKAVSRREMRLFFQFCIVSLIFLLTWSTWQWLPYMSDSKWMGFAVTTLFFLNNCINPTIYLIFNSSLRREIADLFFPERRKTQAKHSKSKKASLATAAAFANAELNLPQVASLKRISYATMSLPQADATTGYSCLSKKRLPYSPLLIRCNQSRNDTDDEDDESRDELESSSDTTTTNQKQPPEGSMTANIMVAQFSLPCVLISKSSVCGRMPELSKEIMVSGFGSTMETALGNNEQETMETSGNSEETVGETVKRSVMHLPTPPKFYSIISTI